MLGRIIPSPSLRFTFFSFLDAPTHLYKRLCLLVGSSVGRSVCHTFVKTSKNSRIELGKKRFFPSAPDPRWPEILHISFIGLEKKILANHNDWQKFSPPWMSYIRKKRFEKRFLVQRIEGGRIFCASL